MDIRLNGTHNTESGKIAVVYARYSSHNQTEQSIEGQFDAARKYAAKKGYTIIKEYADRAKTGRNDNREAFQQMLKDSNAKKFDVIIVWKVDRFGRNRQEINLNKARCHKNNVRIEYVAEVIPDTDEGVILESVLEGFAEYYSRQLSTNVRRGQLENAKKCKSIGGNRLLGYQLDEDKHYIIDEEEAATVRTIFSQYANGKSIFEIIRYLNSLGLRTAKGREFTKNSISGLLKNERYRGIYIFKDMRIEGGIPRIVDDDTFFKVQSMLKINKKAPSSKWNVTDYLLTEKLFCGHCGAPMTGESGTSHTGAKHHYYTCTTKRRKRTCDMKSLKRDVIEQAVIDFTVKMLSDAELIEHIIELTWQHYLAQDETRDELDALRKELKEAEKASNNHIRAVEQGMPFTDGVKARIAELEKQVEELKGAIAERELATEYSLTREEIAYALCLFRDADLDDEINRKRFIKTFINSVYVFDDTLTVNYNFTSDTSAVSLNDVISAKNNKAGGSYVDGLALPYGIPIAIRTIKSWTAIGIFHFP